MARQLLALLSIASALLGATATPTISGSVQGGTRDSAGRLCSATLVVQYQGFPANAPFCLVGVEAPPGFTFAFNAGSASSSGSGTFSNAITGGNCLPACPTSLKFSVNCLNSLSPEQPADPAGLAAPGLCTTGQGDPLLQGFDGRMFDFFGEPDKAFCLISEHDHVLNVKMVAANLANHTGGGTFMQALGLVYKDHTVEANITEQGVMTVVVDGVETAPGDRAYVEWDDGEATVEVEPHYPELGHIAVVSTPLLVLRIQAVQPVTDPATGYNRGHLDFAMSLLSRPPSMHCVLGQTAYNQTRYPLDDMAFHGEGEQADYLVPSVLSASDFTFNLFNPIEVANSGGGRTVLSHAAPERLGEPLVAGKFAHLGLAQI